MTFSDIVLSIFGYSDKAKMMLKLMISGNLVLARKKLPNMIFM